MQPFWLFITATAAAVSLQGRASFDPLSAPPAGVIPLSRQDVHANVLKHHPPQWIINSTNLAVYLRENHGANHTIYLSDDQAFVSMATVEVVNKTSNAKRLIGDPPCHVPIHYYKKTYTKQTQHFPGAWVTASGCFETGKSKTGGSHTFTASFSSSVQENAGLEAQLIADILSANLGITVWKTWSTSDSWQCNIPKHSVGQTWSQGYLAWGWFWSQKCVSGGPDCGSDTCWPEYVDGGATAPAKNPYTNAWNNYGCSTGWGNCHC